MAGGFRGSRAGMKTGKEFFGSDGVFAGVEGGAAQRFHSDEDGRARCENLQGVPDEVFGVVILATAEVPVVADPGQGLGLSDFNRVTYKWRTRLGKSR